MDIGLWSIYLNNFLIYHLIIFKLSKVYVILKSMFRRFSIHLALIFVFAFAQMGAVTHGISHVEDFAKHNQTSDNQQDPNKQDNNIHADQCGKCISFAKVAGGLQAKSFVFNFAASNFFVAEFHHQSYISLTHTAYAARAPPYFI